MKADIIEFPRVKNKENLQAVYTFLDICRKMHDEEGYVYTSSEMKKKPSGEYILTLVLDKPTPDDIPDIIA